jgi:16S rRNA (uracil1498-N3)-methyltransferase
MPLKYSKQIYRLYLANLLNSGLTLDLDKATWHYLTNVLRLKNAHLLKVFNQTDGEFIAEVFYDAKRCYLLIKEQIRQAELARYLHLGICIVRNAIMSDIIDKATQLGVTHITPILSAYTQNKEFAIDRYQRIAKEASEQSNRLDVPLIQPVVKLKDFLCSITSGLLIFANETEQAQDLSSIATWPDQVWILIGPEGGFSDLEIKEITASRLSRSVSLGPYILRSELAAITMLAQIALLKK